MEEKPMKKVDLTKIQSMALKELFDAKLITEQGFRICGMGILINKVNNLWDRLDRMDALLSFINKKFGELLEKKEGEYK